jgi:hypothetical protein
LFGLLYGDLGYYWDILRDIPGIHNSYENMGKAWGSDLEQNGDINGDIKWDIYNDSLWIPSGKKIWLAGKSSVYRIFPFKPPVIVDFPVTLW